MRTSTAEKAGYVCPKCGDKLSRGSGGQGICQAPEQQTVPLRERHEGRTSIARGWPMEPGGKQVDGCGAIKDYVPAHMWPNIASANGLDEARDHQARFGAKMTPSRTVRTT